MIFRVEGRELIHSSLRYKKLVTELSRGHRLTSVKVRALLS